MRAVITGGTGFLGSHLCDRLIAEGWEVLALDNMITSGESNVSHLEKNPRFRVERADVTEVHRGCGTGRLRFALCFASEPIRLSEVSSRNDEGGFRGNAQRAGPGPGERKRNFSWLRPASATAIRKFSPQSEEYWGRVNPIGPRAVYDEAKRFAEAMTMAYHRYYGVDTRIVRIFNTYGPRMRLNDGRALPNFVHQALTGRPITVYGDGKQTRSFCYVSDLIEGIYRLMLSDEHLPTNIGNPAGDHHSAVCGEGSGTL